MSVGRDSQFFAKMKKIIFILFIVGCIFIVLYLYLPVLINQLHATFYSLTYLGFIMVFLAGVFFGLFILQIENLNVYVAAIWISSGTMIFILNEFVYTQFFKDLLLKYFDPLYAIFFCVIGTVILMIEIVRILYLKPAKRSGA
ncbi:MAG: hypothetical protein ACTSQI_16195 [Candidatus Helarchaeota archaeon]